MLDEQDAIDPFADLDLDAPAQGVDQQAGAQPSEQAAEAGTRPKETGTASGDPAQQPTEEEQRAQAQATEDTQPKGNVNAALRASRRAERRARDEAERLRKELDELRAKEPTEKDEPDDLDALEDEFPAAAQALKREREARAAAERRAQELEARANPPKDPDFVPETFPAAVQDAIDDVAELSDWQNDPDQTRFALAKSVDAMLTNHPKWAGKTLQERFAEAVRRVKVELVEDAPPAGRSVRQAIDAAKRIIPETLSDLQGGTPARNDDGPGRFARMNTVDDIFNSI